MTHKVIRKVKTRLKFLHWKNKYLTPNLRRLLYNIVIQPHFDYACSAWYPNFFKKVKNRIQTSQSKCIRFYLQLGKILYIFQKEFETIKWLPIKERYNQ